MMAEIYKLTDTTEMKLTGNGLRYPQRANVEH